MHWERIDQRIDVRADFRAGEATPRLFRLGRRLHRILRVNARWSERQGRSLQHFFAVTTESRDTYQLCFDGEQLAWRADAVMYEG
ncbi:MAG: hypothetical protein GF330_08570 [Candidatus Eisenbacteria bacterium]|nr:hypothetical protein [Candidatus Eisenbacteria bacterium]